MKLLFYRSHVANVVKYYCHIILFNIHLNCHYRTDYNK